jgi:hypothetical protein
MYSNKVKLDMKANSRSADSVDQDRSKVYRSTCQC